MKCKKRRCCDPSSRELEVLLREIDELDSPREPPAAWSSGLPVAWSSGLPVQLLGSIFIFLCVPDILLCLQVCRSWSRLGCADSKVWPLLLNKITPVFPTRTCSPRNLLRLLTPHMVEKSDLQAVCIHRLRVPASRSTGGACGDLLVRVDASFAKVWLQSTSNTANIWQPQKVLPPRKIPEDPVWLGNAVGLRKRAELWLHWASQDRRSGLIILPLSFETEPEWKSVEIPCEPLPIWTTETGPLPQVNAAEMVTDMPGTGASLLAAAVQSRVHVALILVGDPQTKVAQCARVSAELPEQWWGVSGLVVTSRVVVVAAHAQLAVYPLSLRKGDGGLEPILGTPTLISLAPNPRWKSFDRDPFSEPALRLCLVGDTLTLVRLFRGRSQPWSVMVVERVSLAARQSLPSFFTLSLDREEPTPVAVPEVFPIASHVAVLWQTSCYLLSPLPDQVSHATHQMLADDALELRGDVRSATWWRLPTQRVVRGRSLLRGEVVGEDTVEVGAPVAPAFGRDWQRQIMDGEPGWNPFAGVDERFRKGNYGKVGWLVGPGKTAGWWRVYWADVQGAPNHEDEQHAWRHGLAAPEQPDHPGGVGPIRSYRVGAGGRYELIHR